MVKKVDKNVARHKRHARVRGKISGDAKCPRLSVYRSLNNIYAQIIDDESGKTIVSASSVEKQFKGYGGNKEAAQKVGKALADRAKKKKITDVVFDRGGHLYHGRVQALADGARNGGLKF